MNINPFRSKQSRWLKGFLGLMLALVLTATLSIFINPQRAKTEVILNNPNRISDFPQNIPSLSQLPPTDSMANWQTYEDDLYHFVMKYPLYWSFSLDASISPQDRTVYFFDSKRVKRPNQPFLPWEGISIRIVDNEKDLSVQELALELYRAATGGMPLPTSFTLKPLDLKGKTAVKVYGIPSCCTEYIVLVPFRNNKKAIIFSLDSGHIPTTPTQKPKYEEVLLLMLQSLKFQD